MRIPVIPYQSVTETFAKSLRKKMTLAEVLLWNHLKRRQLGVDFDRQKAIGRFVVDFFCKQLRLAVEVDGESHDDKQEKDQSRDNELMQAGIKVIRVWDYDVKHDMEAVVKTIAVAIEARWKEMKNPPRLRHPSGGGDL